MTWKGTFSLGSQVMLESQKWAQRELFPHQGDFALGGSEWVPGVNNSQFHLKIEPSILRHLGILHLSD